MIINSKTTMLQREVNYNSNYSFVKIDEISVYRFKKLFEENAFELRKKYFEAFLYE